jgi:hypothetical protein
VNERTLCHCHHIHDGVHTTELRCHLYTDQCARTVVQSVHVERP